MADEIKEIGLNMQPVLAQQLPSDITVPPTKTEIIQNAMDLVDVINRDFAAC